MTASFTIKLTMLAVSATCLPGCLPSAPDGPLTKQQVYATLDAVMLDPSISCEELREGFGVEHLQVVYTPSEVGINYEETYVAAHDATPLRVWYMPTALDRGTVLLSMGAVGSMPCYLFTAKLLLDNGWSVVMYDYRGFGGSGGIAGIESLNADLDALMDWTISRTGREQITLMGVSLGTIPTIAAAVDRPEEINGVILDSPVALGLEIQRFEFVVGDVAAYLSLLDPRLISETIIAAMTTPMLVLMNENDFLTPPAQTELLYELGGGPKELARFPDVGHARAVFRDTGYYTFRVETFLSRTWGQHIPLPLLSE